MTREEIARAYEYKIPPKFLTEGGGSGSDEVWYPHISEQGVISWTKENTASAPTPTNIKGADGQNGTDGRGIVSVTKLVSVGLVDTYQILFTDNTTSTFYVTNGAEGARGEAGAKGDTGTSITSIVKTGTSGLVDTYTVYFSNGSTTTFTVTNGANGKSAYQVAVDNGYEGSEEGWLASLHGADGESAYQIAVDNGYEGTEEEWLASLIGPQGPTGETGPQGPAGADGRGAEFIPLDITPTENFNPNVSENVKFQATIPVVLHYDDDTTANTNLTIHGVLPSMGEEGRYLQDPSTLMPPTEQSRNLIQIVEGMIYFDNGLDFSKIPFTVPQFCKLRFTNWNNGFTQQWYLSDIFIDGTVYQSIEQETAGNIWYDVYDPYANISFDHSIVQTNPAVDLSSGKFLDLVLGVTDTRNWNTPTTTNGYIKIAIPALPTPAQLGAYMYKQNFEGVVNIEAHDDLPSLTLFIRGAITFIPEFQNTGDDTWAATGKYTMRSLYINHGHISSVNLYYV